MTLEQLNTADLTTFTTHLGWIFEHSPWVAEAVYPLRPFPTLAVLHAAMVHVVESAPPEAQLALIQAHPDLGTRARLSTASSNEQQGAGLDTLTPTEYEELHTLNTAYKNKFGFPFIYAVKGSTKHDILRALRDRLPGHPDAERGTALQQIYRIAQFRLEDTFHAPIR